MAFGKGQVSVENTVKRYIGVASVKILALNPTKSELEGLYGRPQENEPKYIEDTEVNGTPVKRIRLDFIVQADPAKYEGINFTQRVSFYLTNYYRYNRDNTKVQVIDKYGRTAWVTIEQAKNHEIPMYSNGPANLDKDYRPAYIGEEDLIKFLIAYLNIPSCQRYIDGKWVMNDTSVLPDSEARLECIPNYFNNDISELRNIIKYQPNNTVKILFGIKNNSDGRQFVTAFTRFVLKSNANDYTKFKKEVEQVQNAGGLANCEFDYTELHEYVVSNTNFNSTAAELPFSPANDLPFSNSNSSIWEP